MKQHSKHIISGFRHDDKRRKEFNELAEAHFGINFEVLYEKQLWHDQFVNYGYVIDDELVASVSCHHLSIVKDGKTYKAMSIGAVMTKKAHRKNGYAKEIMDVVFAENQVDVMYLSANETVLEFYPRFGFKPTEHIHYLLEEAPAFDAAKTGEKLSLEEDYELILETLNQSIDHTKSFTVQGHGYIRMFYLLFVFRNCIYKHEEGIVICYKEGETLIVHDLFLTEHVDMKALLSGYTEGVKSIECHFDVQLEDIKPLVVEDTHLFVKTDVDDLNQPWALPNAAIT